MIDQESCIFGFKFEITINTGNEESVDINVEDLQDTTFWDRNFYLVKFRITRMNPDSHKEDHSRILT